MPESGVRREKLSAPIAIWTKTKTEPWRQSFERTDHISLTTNSAFFTLYIIKTNPEDDYTLVEISIEINRYVIELLLFFIVQRIMQ